jgi:hypothetical protein
MTKKRRRVGRPVVDAPTAERQRRRISEPHLVQDATGLLVCPGIDLAALEARERLQYPECKVWVDYQRHPRRDERVPPEHRHEPGRSSSNHDAFGKIRVEYAKRPEILGTALESASEFVVVAFDLRHLRSPAGEPLGRHGTLD